MMLKSCCMKSIVDPGERTDRARGLLEEKSLKMLILNRNMISHNMIIAINKRKPNRPNPLNASASFIRNFHETLGYH